MEFTSFEVFCCFPLAPCYRKSSWFHDATKLFYLQRLFLKNYILKILDLKSPPLYYSREVMQLPISAGTEWCPSDFYRYLYAHSDICTLLPVDGVTGKKAVPIKFCFILDATGWKHLAGVYSCVWMVVGS